MSHSKRQEYIYPDSFDANNITFTEIKNEKDERFISLIEDYQYSKDINNRLAILMPFVKFNHHKVQHILRHNIHAKTVKIQFYDDDLCDNLEIINQFVNKYERAVRKKIEDFCDVNDFCYEETIFMHYNNFEFDLPINRNDRTVYVPIINHNVSPNYPENEIFNSIDAKELQRVMGYGSKEVSCMIKPYTWMRDGTNEYEEDNIKRLIASTIYYIEKMEVKYEHTNINSLIERDNNNLLDITEIEI